VVDVYINYASSQVDKRKVGKLSLAIQVAFQELGVFPASTTQIPLDSNAPMPFSTAQAIENVKRNAALGRIESLRAGKTFGLGLCGISSGCQQSHSAGAGAEPPCRHRHPRHGL
jgi:hypothetical protein